MRSIADGWAAGRATGRRLWLHRAPATRAAPDGDRQERYPILRFAPQPSQAALAPQRYSRGWSFARSILGRSFHVIDHQRLHLALRRLEPQPPNLQRREDPFIF